MNKKSGLPTLPYNEWTETRLTIHMILQIIGKSRLKLTPRKNHWWFITLYVSNKGFETLGIPLNNGIDLLNIEMDILNKKVVLAASNGESKSIILKDGLSVSDFYKEYMTALSSFGLSADFVATPFDLPVTKPFSEITEYYHYDWDYINRFWTLMRWNNNVFQEFSGRFYGKTCPVHIYWHHLDLTVTRFSGKKLPPMDKSARLLEKETYSHEQISFGFWIGDDNMQEPMYYAYAYPSPDGIDQEKLLPDSAMWIDSNGSPMTLLKYEDVRNAADPKEAVLIFLESVYQAGAKQAKWNVAELTVPALDKL